MRSGWWVVRFAALLIGCAGTAEQAPEAPQAPEPEQAPEPAHDQEADTREGAGAGGSAAEPSEDVRQSAAATSGAEQPPSVFTRMSFDLRSLPHRGPYDVDPGLVSGRVQLLMQRVRDAVGEPAPRLLIYPGASVFRAEFLGPRDEAMAQCQRAIDAVAPPPAQDEASIPLAAFDRVRATPCAPIETDTED